jgi:hypothetical protein
MMDEKLRLLQTIILISGSIMEGDDVLNQYQRLTPPKKKYLHDKAKRIVKRYNKPFDEAQPLLVVDIGVCAAEDNVDPAVVLLALISKGK